MGACRPRPSPAAGNTRTRAHTRDHTVTTPPEPRSAPACLAVVFMIAVAAGMSLPATWEPVASPLALDAFVVHPWNHRSPHLPSLATGEHAYATSPPASTTEPPFAVASALVSPGRHLDPTIAVAVA